MTVNQTYNLSPETKIFLKKMQGKTLVFTNGCFDIIHRGHVTYLNEARKLGDALIVGLNTDQSVRRLNKGPNRPINNELDRKFVLENLKAIDCVQLFDEETPLELIKTIRPNILVKGADYSIDTIVGAKEVIGFGGKVLTIDLVTGFSTTATIKKMTEK